MYLGLVTRPIDPANELDSLLIPTLTRSTLEPDSATYRDEPEDDSAARPGLLVHNFRLLLQGIPWCRLGLGLRD